MQRSLLAVTLLCWKSEVSLIFTFIKSSQESHEWRFAESNLQIHSNVSASLLILAFCNVLHPCLPLMIKPSCSCRVFHYLSPLLPVTIGGVFHYIYPWPEELAVVHPHIWASQERKMWAFLSVCFSFEGKIKEETIQQQKEEEKE